MKQAKKMKSALTKFEKSKKYQLEDAISLVKNIKFSNFDESVDVAVNLNVDPRHAEENVRITAALPHGTGKKVSVLVIASGVKEKEAEEAGADFVGNKDYLSKIKNGWTDVDKIVATPDMMGELGKLGKILGPKGLMPNPKSGTVTMNIKQAVEALKSGQVELRVDSNGIIHVSCGKSSFSEKHLKDNILTVYSALMKARPASVKGTYLNKITISTTMGPGILIDQSLMEN